MKKIILIVIVTLFIFADVNAKSFVPTKKDIEFVQNVLKNEAIEYSDNSCYRVVYGKKIIVLTIYKQYTTRIYQLKDGYIYSIMDIFPDGAEYYGPEN
jgi:hypothetical protein